MNQTLQVETLNANEVVSCLWNKNASEKCRVGLSDIVVYEHGQPARWYVTGKTGEILKKRGIDKVAISQRWTRVATQSESPFVAILRQEAGMFKFLSHEAWTAFLPGQLPDNSMISLHCFVNGSNNLVYRNKFELRDRIGRFKTSTQSYSFFDQGIPSEDISVVRENSFKFTETKAPALKNVMDLATNTVVRYLEMMLGVKVISLSIDYVIDTKSQLWMLWTSPAKIVRSTSLWDYSVPGLDDGESAGRATWAGITNSNAADPLAATRTSSPSAKSPLRGSAGVGPPTSSSSSRGLRAVSAGRVTQPTESTRGKAVMTGYDYVGSDGTFVGSSENVLSRSDKLTGNAASAQVLSASNIIDTSLARAKPKSRRSKTNRFHISTPFVVDALNEHAVDDDKFPNPFKCKGDYCRVHMQSIGALSSDPSMGIHSSAQFFSEREVSTLKKDRHFNQMMDLSSSGAALAMMSNKSIREARAERRGLKREERQLWEDYPLTPRQKSGVDDAESKAGSTQVSKLMFFYK
jgi:hypothetical protein